MLEQKIQELNETIQKLISKLDLIETKPKTVKDQETVSPIVEPLAVVTEPEPAPSEDEEDDSALWEEESADDMTVDAFRKALLPLGPAKGPSFLAKQGYKKVTDVPAAERAAVAEAAKLLLGN